MLLFCSCLILWCCQSKPQTDRVVIPLLDITKDISMCIEFHLHSHNTLRCKAIFRNLPPPDHFIYSHLFSDESSQQNLFAVNSLHVSAGDSQGWFGSLVKCRAKCLSKGIQMDLYYLRCMSIYVDFLVVWQVSCVWFVCKMQEIL